MVDDCVFEEIDAMAAVYAVDATLRRIDRRLMDHGERVAFIACSLCQQGKLDLDMKVLFLLSIYHNVGAYKTEEIDRMVEFETNEVWGHSIYGYLFLKNMTPLSEYARAVLYHHASWEALEKSDIPYREYAALIHLADRLDIAFLGKQSADELAHLLDKDKRLFFSDYVDIAKRCCREHGLFEGLADGSYREYNRDICSNFLLSPAEVMEFIKMIVYSIDFRSEHTVTHTVNTVSLSMDIAQHFCMTELELKDIYLGSLLHDVGKIAIPPDILEYPGRLSPEQMEIMRTHVVETRVMIEGIVPQRICEIAARHHEKLDGSGYPNGLVASELTVSQRIVAVADIVSALSSRRSYKDPFPKEKTLQILTDMSGSQLDEKVCEYVLANYDAIIDSTEPDRARVIAQYQAIMHEFDELSLRVKSGESLLEYR